MSATLFLVYNTADPRQVTAAKLITRISERPVDSLDLNPPAGSLAPAAPNPSDDRSRVIRDELIRRFDRASKMLVLIGEDTHTDPWVDWQVKTFYQLKDPYYLPNTWKCLRGLRLKQCEQATVPPALDGRSTSVSAWDPELIEDWLLRDLDT